MCKTSPNISSKRHFQWTKKVRNENEDEEIPASEQILKIIEEEMENDKIVASEALKPANSAQATRRKLQAVAISRLRSVLTRFGRNRSSLPLGLGPKVVGTLFWIRRGHVHFVSKKDPTS